MRRHAPGAGPPAFGDHDGELVHGVRLQPYHGVTQSGRICRLQRMEQRTALKPRFPLAAQRNAVTTDSFPRPTKALRGLRTLTGGVPVPQAVK